MGSEQAEQRYGRVSNTVLILTVLVMLVIVAAIAVLPMRDIMSRDFDGDGSRGSTAGEAGSPLPLPEETQPAPLPPP